jgi:hypothetical protein
MCRVGLLVALKCLAQTIPSGAVDAPGRFTVQYGPHVGRKIGLWRSTHFDGFAAMALPELKQALLLKPAAFSPVQ